MKRLIKQTLLNPICLAAYALGFAFIAEILQLAFGPSFGNAFIIFEMFGFGIAGLMLGVWIVDNAPAAFSPTEQESLEQANAWIDVALKAIMYVAVALIVGFALLAASPGRANTYDLPDRAELYQADIERAVQRYFPDDFKVYPIMLTAQIRQESNFDPKAQSHAGAGGLGQQIKDTQAWLAGLMGIEFDRFNADHSIRGSAFQMGRYLGQLNRRGRTPDEAFEIAWCFYNAGPGHCLKAQRLCNNGRTWAEISPCQPQVTGKHASETIDYVIKIPRWANIYAAPSPWAVPQGFRDQHTQERRTSLSETTTVRRWFTGQSWCTYFRIGDGWASAGHCHDEVSADGSIPPPFIQGKTVHYGGPRIDAVFYGDDLSALNRTPLSMTERVELIGYPAGSDQLSYRSGEAYLPRMESRAFIVAMVTGPTPSFEREPVVGGMSGSPVMVNGDIRCILTTQNGLVDLNADGVRDNSFDCAPLSEAFAVFSETR